jgi:hypothetical protein
MQQNRRKDGHLQEGTISERDARYPRRSGAESGGPWPPAARPGDSRLCYKIFETKPSHWLRYGGPTLAN